MCCTENQQNPTVNPEYFYAGTDTTQPFEIFSVHCGTPRDTYYNFSMMMRISHTPAPPFFHTEGVTATIRRGGCKDGCYRKQDITAADSSHIDVLRGRYPAQNVYIRSLCIPPSARSVKILGKHRKRVRIPRSSLPPTTHHRKRKTAGESQQRLLCSLLKYLAMQALI